MNEIFEVLIGKEVKKTAKNNDVSRLCEIREKEDKIMAKKLYK